MNLYIYIVMTLQLLAINMQYIKPDLTSENVFNNLLKYAKTTTTTSKYSLIKNNITLQTVFRKRVKYNRSIKIISTTPNSIKPNSTKPNSTKPNSTHILNSVIVSLINLFENVSTILCKIVDGVCID